MELAIAATPSNLKKFSPGIQACKTFRVEVMSDQMLNGNLSQLKGSSGLFQFIFLSAKLHAHCLVTRKANLL